MTSISVLSGHLLRTLSRSVKLPSRHSLPSQRWWANSIPIIRTQSFSEATDSAPVSTLQALDQQPEHRTFEALFENSKFAQIVDPVGKKVQGEIIAIVGDNLYVDFGCKFHGVVKRPGNNDERYIEGAKVVLKVKDLEMSMHPLGSSGDLSLLEAEVEFVSD